MSTKANKPDIYRIEQALSDRALLKDFLAFKTKIEGELAQQVAVFDKATKKLDSIHKSIGQDIYLEVKRATSHLKQETKLETTPAQGTSPGMSVQSIDVLERSIQMKASRDQVDQLAAQKANKHDVAQQMVSIDILHKQIVHLSVLLVELIKQGVKLQSDSKIERQQKQKLLLTKAASVLGWAHKFDP